MLKQFWGFVEAKSKRNIKTNGCTIPTQMPPGSQQTKFRDSLERLANTTQKYREIHIYIYSWFSICQGKSVNVESAAFYTLFMIHKKRLIFLFIQYF